MIESFTNPSVYLSPRAARNAHKAGVLALFPIADHLAGIRKNLQDNLPSLGPKQPWGELALVVRWGGKIGCSMDVRYCGASAKQLYLPSEQFGVRDEEHAWVTKSNIQATDKAVVEVKINDWCNPEWGYRVAEGLSQFGRYPSGSISAAYRFLTQPASVEEGIKFMYFHDSQRRFPHPISAFTTRLTGDCH